ncbi:MAG: riboflavin synthase [Alphaproteobacteria bacterium]|nr:riboflavin synthase [Alphaproteobacteria bacterium]
MFTGIITDVGRVRAAQPGDSAGDTRFELETAYETDGIAIGASIACSGACLTVIEKGPNWFAVEASGETLSRTILGRWQVGSPVNLERSLAMGDELGGHLVAGHVDGVAVCVGRAPDGGSVRFTFEVPEPLAPYIASKGSVAIDGVSLTVNEVEGRRFGVNIIAHTLTCTTFGSLGEGDKVNLEVDLLARYVARLMGKD